MDEWSELCTTLARDPHVRAGCLLGLLPLEVGETAHSWARMRV